MKAPSACALCLIVSGCGAAGEGAAGADSKPARAAFDSGTATERFFPLVDRHIYQYAVEDATGAVSAMMVRAGRDDAKHGKLWLPSAVRAFEYRADGVVLTSHKSGGLYVLKQPLALGNRWYGEHGGWVTIAAIDAPVEVPAGSFAGCVQTVEERGGDVPLRIATWLCPGVGVVLVEGTSGDAVERIRLSSYGPPVEIGPEGVRLVR